MRGLRRVLLALALGGCAWPSHADILPRSQPAAGTVIARKVGEEVRFIDISGWRGVDVDQDLLPGDVLRTNALGNLAVLFSDRTQVRLGRNTTLVVKQIGTPSETRFSLESGTIWARAERGGQGLTVETPAAAAAIRGTDWTMTVEGDKTSIIVLEGLVEFYNPQGSVNVAEGEAAVATIGQKPSKVVIVDPDDRQQMLYYLSLRNSFGWMPASPLSSPEMRRMREAIGAKPPASRSVEDWLTLAEASLNYDGKAVALAAADHVRGKRLTRAQQARLDLIDALAAGANHDFAGAAKLFRRAAPALDPRRRAIALYGGYFARSLAEPSRAEPEPSAPDSGPYGALAKAWTTGFLKDIPAAIEIIRQAEAKYPDDPSLPAYRAQLAILIDDRSQVEEAIARSLAIDPDDPTALEARSYYKSGIQSDLKGALADIERAAALAPGSSSAWNAMGNIHSARGGMREAEAAFKRAIELEPMDPVSYANLAILYLDQDRVAEAKVLIDKALELDPAFEVALTARGRYHLQTGELEKGVDDLLAASTVNPAYSQGLLLLSAGYYESGQREPAEQALENADRLDPNDPVTADYETAIAIDDYDSDRAIASAQDALRRSRARGGDYAPVSANTDAGSTLNEAFRLQGLDAWGRFYSDSAFDAFSGAAYVDQAVTGSADPFTSDITYGGNAVVPTINDAGFSALFQGLMFSPEMISGRSRSANLIRRPFVEGAIGGGFVKSGTDWKPTGEAELQSFQAGPIPWSFYGNVKWQPSQEYRQYLAPGTAIPYTDFTLDFEPFSGTGYITARPTPNDRIVTYIDIQDVTEKFVDSHVDIDIPTLFYNALDYNRDVRTRSTTGAVGWSHTFGYHNVLNAAAFVSGFKQTSDSLAESFILPFLPGIPITTQHDIAESDETTYLGALNHTVEIGDVVWRYGVEGGQVNLDQSLTSTFGFPLVGGSVTSRASAETDVTFGRVYLDASTQITTDLKAEAGLFATFFDGAVTEQRLDPRIGLAWDFMPGHSLRGGYFRETEAANTTTLSPIGIVGLQSNQAPLDVGGYSDTFAARWDAEWTRRFFTSVDYQHQSLHNLSIPIPGSIETVSVAEGSIDRVSGTANLWLGHGFGLFANAAYVDSKDEDPASPGYGDALAYVPDTTARVGITWVNPANIKVTLAASYVGDRESSAPGSPLDAYWTADAFLTWEPFDKRFELQLAAYNLFDEEFLVAPNTPGWGQTFTGSLKVRF
ncbi:MAG: FecR domain-containing protein [Rhizobiaceae bacterium]|nr:FecR domain-containing protein [Rhizobiaceae bacterium]